MGLSYDIIYIIPAVSEISRQTALSGTGIFQKLLIVK